MPDDARVLAERTVDLLSRGGVRLEAGLDEEELAGLEDDLGLVLAPEHRALLRLALPTGRRWPDWRRMDAAQRRERVERPVDGVVFDVVSNGFWHPAWGAPPEDPVDRERVARRRLEDVPRLVSVYGHRYLAAASPGAQRPGPVLSVHQSDVVGYGADLADWAARELGLDEAPGPSAVAAADLRRRSVPFWSEL